MHARSRPGTVTQLISSSIHGRELELVHLLASPQTGTHRSYNYVFVYQFVGAKGRRSLPTLVRILPARSPSSRVSTARRKQAQLTSIPAEYPMGSVHRNCELSLHEVHEQAEQRKIKVWPEANRTTSEEAVWYVS